MHKTFIVLLMTMLSLGLAVGEAQAKRFGGGKSFGDQRQSAPHQQAPHAQPAPAGGAAAAGMGGNRWLGPLAGLAAGGLLASLFMGGGFQGISPLDIFLLLGVAALVYFGVRAWRRSSAQHSRPMQYAAAGAMGGGQITPPDIGASREIPLSSSSVNPVSYGRPSWFDEQEFIRAAKANFIRLQAAYDTADLSDIREYTTPEVYAEISVQIQERGAASQHTEVVQLNVEIVNFITEREHSIVSVRYSGEIREEAGSPAVPFVEIWNIKRALNQPGAHWYIAGIQQA